MTAAANTAQHTAERMADYPFRTGLSEFEEQSGSDLEFTFLLLSEFDELPFFVYLHIKSFPPYSEMEGTVLLGSFNYFGTLK